MLQTQLTLQRAPLQNDPSIKAKPTARAHSTQAEQGKEHLT